MSLRLVDSVADRLARALACERPLDRLGGARRAELLAAAIPRFESRARESIAELEASSGLKKANLLRGLSDALESMSLERFIEILERAERSAPPGTRPSPLGLHLSILPSNVFTAPLRALILPLLFGNPVIAKASSRGDRLAHLFADALTETFAEAEPALRDALFVLTFSSQERDLLERLLVQAKSVAAYGTDQTVRAIRELLPAQTRYQAHGSGLGLALMDGPADEATLARFAEDIIAFDQRGCLSPHALFTLGDARQAAEALERALSAASFRRPRGALPLELASAQLQWRAVGEARGELIEGHDFAITIEPAGPPRISPGYRNIAIIPLESKTEFLRIAASFGQRLKALGIESEECASLIDELPLLVSPRISRFGEMQRPAIDEPWEGLAPHEGFVLYRAAW
ncbi:MAG: hypothetical protein GX614_02130 [Sandaracinaceae bacterium]|nr:hypothetical protein [Sandaracinaceae bacterium]